ncbi:MAG: acyl-ACP--UDP-N-acetylglucosamine O-acyltransferase [Candidatus Omnitrophota bacterium]|nr:acyl-ACP--UDP-N-acetylglucosamine O-acyltransferase [Candidatus Omnitrophota bacterium]
MTKISELAVISKSAKIAEGVEIGPYAIIEDDVFIDQNVKIWPHAHICSGTTIADGSQVHMGAVVGHLPQDLTFDVNKKTQTKIGKHTVIREYATIHRATKEGECTTIGDNCYLMAVSHVGHDCHVGNNVILANGALLAGHVEVGDSSFISGNVVVHQFCRIGNYVIVGGFSGINMDVPPYLLVRGPSVVRGVNLIGLRRAKFGRDTIHKIMEAFKLLCKSNLNTTQAIDEIKKLGPSKELDYFMDFIRGSKRGICKYKYSDSEYFE